MNHPLPAFPAIDIFPWDDNFNTGLGEIDEQHKKLVDLLNALASHVAFRTDTLQLDAIFGELAAYAEYHFTSEEAIWNRHLSAEDMNETHRQIHRDFVATVTRLQEQRHSRSLDELAEDALGFLARWLAAHILESDRHMAYIVLAVREGLSMEAAKARAVAQMSGATRVLINIILSIYDTLSSNTLHLMRELAERKRREGELIQARLKVETANLAKSQFLANMSHEVRNPLNTIAGMAQLLRQGPVSEEEREAYADAILDASRQLLALHENLLNLANVETGLLAVEAGMFDPTLLLREIRDEYELIAAGKGLSLSLRVENGIAPRYRSDSQRIRQMLRNLMSNAIKFTRQGGIEMALREIRGEGMRTLLEFAVSDTGIGVAPDKQHLLFQPFSQLDASMTRAYEGSGVGLAVVRGFAELLGGQVGVRSQPGQGATFWFAVQAEPIRT